MNVRIKKARDLDEAFAHDLTRTNMESYVARHWGKWDGNIFSVNYKKRENYIIWRDNAPAGYLALSEKDSVLRIEDLQISSSHQGIGLGTMAMNWAEKVALDKSLGFMEVRVFHDNPAKRLYVRLGYEPEFSDECTETMKKATSKALQLDAFGATDFRPRLSNK